jgi:hypothetical protein
MTEIRKQKSLHNFVDLSHADSYMGRQARTHSVREKNMLK